MAASAKAHRSGTGCSRFSDKSGGLADEERIQPRCQRLAAQREFETSHDGRVVRNYPGNHCDRDLVCAEAVTLLRSSRRNFQYGGGGSALDPRAALSPPCRRSLKRATL